MRDSIERNVGRDLAIESLLKNCNAEGFVSCGENAIRELQIREDRIKQKGRRTSSSGSYRSISSCRTPAIKSAKINKPLIGGVLGGVFVVAAAIMFLTIIQPMLNVLPGRPLIKESVNQVFIIRGNKKINAKVGDYLRAGDELLVLPASQALVAYDDQSLVLLHEKSSVIFEHKSDSKMTKILKGALFFKVFPQDKSTPFMINTINCEVEVVGTSFDLSHRNNKTTLKMKTGIVRVNDLVKKEIKLVERGQELIIDGNEVYKPKEQTVWQPIGRIANDNNALYHYSNYKGSELTNYIADQSSLVGHKVIKGYSISKEAIRLAGGNYFAKSDASKELSAIVATGEMTVEFWLKGDIENDQSGLVFSMGEKKNNVVSAQNWHFVIEQEASIYQVYLRTSEHEVKLKDMIIKKEVLQNSHHFVITVSANGSVRTYINGEKYIERKSKLNLKSWSSLKKIFYQIGGAVSVGHSWEGELYMMSLYSKALTPEEIKTNFNFGFK